MPLYTLMSAEVLDTVNVTVHQMTCSNAKIQSSAVMLSVIFLSFN